MRQKDLSKSQAIEFFLICGLMCLFLLTAATNGYPLAIAEVHMYTPYFSQDYHEGQSSSSASLQDSLANGWTVVDIPTGILKTYLITTLYNSSTLTGADVSSYATLSDSFTLLGLPQGTNWITAHLQVTGTLQTPTGIGTNWWSGYSVGFGTGAYEILYPDPGGTENINIDLWHNYSVQSGVPFDITATLSAWGHGWKPNDILSDFSGTAKLSFDLPDGTTISSTGGYYQSANQQVPEPATILLLSSGLAAMVWKRRKGFRKFKNDGSN